MTSPRLGQPISAVQPVSLALGVSGYVPRYEALERGRSQLYTPVTVRDGFGCKSA